MIEVDDGFYRAAVSNAECQAEKMREKLAKINATTAVTSFMKPKGVKK